jgi:serine O-acetyltransferase
MLQILRKDVLAALERDPAARSKWEVVLTYPGVHALFFYRLSHECWGRGWFFMGRVLSQLGRFWTGIEIHPGATIGPGCFIDHGMGVVIGETAELGKDITLYQGVTLGGTSLEKGKRHPTLEDGVIVGAGAKILGPIVIGAGARIGSNAVVLKPIPAGATALGIPAKVVERERTRRVSDFCAYGLSTDDIPDPIARSLDGLLEMVCSLQSRVEFLEKEKAAKAVPLAAEDPLIAKEKPASHKGNGPKQVAP